jgi:hypothetical protein
VSSWNPFVWDFWSGASTGAAATQETHQQVVSAGHSVASHAANAAGGSRATIYVAKQGDARE